VFRMTAKNTDQSKSRLLSNPGYYTICLLMAAILDGGRGHWTQF
jgi:hypothetical protein